MFNIGNCVFICCGSKDGGVIDDCPELEPIEPMWPTPPKLPIEDGRGIRMVLWRDELSDWLILDSLYDVDGCPEIELWVDTLRGSDWLECWEGMMAAMEDMEFPVYWFTEFIDGWEGTEFHEVFWNDDLAAASRCVEKHWRWLRSRSRRGSWRSIPSTDMRYRATSATHSRKPMLR